MLQGLRYGFTQGSPLASDAPLLPEDVEEARANAESTAKSRT